MSRRRAGQGILARFRGRLETAILVVAISSTVAGSVLSATTLSGGPGVRTVESGEVAEAGGLVLKVDYTGLLNHDPQLQDGSAIPSTMAMGAPAAGQQRLHVELTLQNNSGTSMRYSTSEFRLGSDEGEIWTPLEDGRSSELLEAGRVVNLDLFFDVQETRQPSHLLWDRDESRILVPVTGDHEEPEHGHD